MGPLFPGFLFPWLQLLTVNHNLEILSGNFQKHRTHRFLNCDPFQVEWWHPTQSCSACTGRESLHIQHIPGCVCYLPVSSPSWLNIASAVLKSPLLYLTMVQECKSGDADNLYMPKKSHRVCPLREKVRVLNIRKEMSHRTLRLLWSMVNYCCPSPSVPKLNCIMGIFM